MKKENSLHDELESLSPFLLAQKGKPDGYEVPTDYFRALPNEVMGKVAQKRSSTMPTKEGWIDRLSYFWHRNYFSPRYALAYLSFALLLTAGIYLWKNSQTSLNQTQTLLATDTLNEVPDDVLQSYISENIDDFDENILITELANMLDIPLQTWETESDDDLLLDELLETTDLDDLEDLL